MSFRLRLTVLASLAVAAAIVGTSFVVYYVDRHELTTQVDGDLRSTLTLAPLKAAAAGNVLFRRGLRVSRQYQLTAPTPKAPKLVPRAPFSLLLPHSSTAVQVKVVQRAGATAIAKTLRISTKTVDGAPARVLTLRLPTGTITVSRSLADVNRNLSHLKWLLVFISMGGVGAAAILGAAVATRAVAPLRRLTETTERIVETGDLSERTGRRGRDEISRLSTRLDELLASLEASLHAQRQLVADASHELRTPIATLRANIGLLANPRRLDAAERKELLADVQDELESMTTLVEELVELARGEEPDLAPREFRLDEVAREAVDRVARRASGLSFRTKLEPSLVTGVPERVERAVANLLDNARKWSPPGGTIEVGVHDGMVEVRDHGPGIAAEDLPLVFDRFYRARAARSLPGAGLGLSIVKQIAEAHGGSVAAEQAPGGGALLRLRLSGSR